MNRRLLTTIFLLQCVHAQERLRKVSGDAAPEKAQEPIVDDLEDFIPTIDSSVQLDHIPEPPALILPVPPQSADIPQPPASRPVHPAPPSPPSLKPSDAPTVETTLLPPTSTSFTLLDETVTTPLPYDHEQVTVDINDILPEPTDDLEEFQKADILEQEKDDEVKDLVKKTTVNTTDDYYITSPATTVTSLLQSDTVGEEDVFDFDSLFAKKIVVKDSASTVQTTEEVATTEAMSTTTTPTTTPSTTTTTTKHVTTNSSHVHKKTCIHVEELKKVDESVIFKAGTKKGTIEVSVELGDDDDSDDSSEEEEAPVRHVRENKKPAVVWKKFEMNCDEEEDEKGTICKLWAVGGLCGTHKPTMFLFCRKTCLCVGPN